MAKTRGGGSQDHDRKRPTTSVRRRDRGGVEERIGDDFILIMTMNLNYRMMTK